jgi:hypothetical protein
MKRIPLARSRNPSLSFLETVAWSRPVDADQYSIAILPSPFFPLTCPRSNRFREVSRTPVRPKAIRLEFVLRGKFLRRALMQRRYYRMQEE